MKITIPGKPIAKRRPRFARHGKFVRTYNDQETEEGRFLFEAKQQIDKPPMEGPLAVSCRFFMPRPKSHYGTGRNAGKLKASAPDHHIIKPDIDNLKKFVLDCLNGVAWKDDCQVIKASLMKGFSENPRTEIEISRIEV